MRTPSFLYSLAFLPLLILPVTTVAMIALEEEEMAVVSGAGLAFVFDDFSLRQAPTSYIELIGSAPTTAAVSAGWQRGDARYYGLSFTSGSDAGADWFGGPGGCATSAGVPNLRCPMGTGSGDPGRSAYGVGAFASVYDPFVLRVFEYQGFDYQGAYRTGTTGATAMPTILEFRGPSNTDAWRWAFWGELEVGQDGENPAPRKAAGTCNSSTCGSASGANFLQSQTIVYGRPVAQGRKWNGLNASGADQGYGSADTRPAILRLMETQNNADKTLGITYQSALSGDFRFSVRQLAGSPDALHWVPDFSDQEGLHFRNVDAFLPLGTLHYQALTFSGVSSYNVNAQRIAPTQNGNFTMELTRIPNIASVYNHFYCGVISGGCATDSRGAIANPNPDTHGYVRWGNWTDASNNVINPYTSPLGATANSLPNANSQMNGIYFVGGNSGATPTNTATNIGISRVEGMLIQHMKITTLGAVP